MHSTLRGFVLCTCILLQSVLLLKAQESLSRTCANTRSGMEIIGLPSSTNLVYTSLKPTSGRMCLLDKTCCSSEGEGILQDSTVITFEETIKSAMRQELSKCQNDVLFAEIAKYVDKVKEKLVSDLLHVYGVYFRGHEGIFDELYNYLKTAIVTGDTTSLPQIFHQMFFEVYFTTYVVTPGTFRLPDSEEVRDCFYDYFVEHNSYLLEGWLNGFQRSFTKLMHYLRALKAANLVIESTRNHVMKGQCKLSLMKMHNCALCAGYQTRSLMPCNGLCLNIVRGCLLDLSDLAEPMTSFSQVLVAMKEHISRFSFFEQILILETSVFRMIDITGRSTSTISTDVSSQCISSQRRKRSDSSRTQRAATGQQSHLAPRSTVVFSLDNLNNSAYCLHDSWKVFSNLPNHLCQDKASSSNQQCWNGHSYGSYSLKVMDFRRPSQADNPEMMICPKDASQFIFEINLLRQITTEMASISGTCSTDDEDCGEVKPITQYYNYTSVSSTVLTIVVEEEEGMSGSGSGSGSGTVTGDVCDLEQPNSSAGGNQAATTDKTIDENIHIQTATTQNIQTWSQSARLLPSITITVLLLAMSYTMGYS